MIFTCYTAGIKYFKEKDICLPKKILYLTHFNDTLKYYVNSSRELSLPPYAIPILMSALELSLGPLCCLLGILLASACRRGFCPFGRKFYRPSFAECSHPQTAAGPVTKRE